MDTHEKVKDELIKELQKLQQENNSLKRGSRVYHCQ